MEKPPSSFRSSPAARCDWIVVGLLTLLLLPASVVARPKIGLVLGGGSARGFADIGVLEWFAENRIPVDYVVGTSMGGLVGSLYAMGYSPREMEQLVEGLDWDELFASSPPYTDLQFRRKQDAAEYPVRFELGLKGGVKIPRGLNTGHFIDLLFQRLTLPYSDLPNFDDLPTPFRCVAVDLETGNQVVFGDGPLWQALRATMAIPGVFTPAQVGGRLLIDGGVLNNLPTDVARSLGADIVIAVDVETPLQNRESLESLLNVIDQTINIMMLQNLRRSIREADLVLSPDLVGFQSLDFKKSTEIIRVGAAAASSRSALLSPLALSESEWQSYLRRRRQRRRTQTPSVRGIQVLGVDPAMSRTLTRRLSAYATGPVEPDRLDRALTRIYGRGQYASVGYQVVEQEGANRLDILVRRHSYGPPFVRFGLNIDGSNLDDIRFGVRARTTLFDLGHPGSETRIDLGLGRPHLAALEYYLPLAGPWFLAPRAYGVRETTGVFSGDDRVSDFLETRAGFGLDTGYGVGSTHGEVRLGYDLFHATGKVSVGEPVLPPTSQTVHLARIEGIYDHLDDPVIPAKGLRTSLRWRHYFAAPEVSSLNQADAQALLFEPLNPRDRLFVRLAGGTTFEKDAPFSLAYALGGPLRLGAYEQGRFRGSRFFYGSAGFLHRVVDNTLLVRGATYIGAWYEMGSAFDRNQDATVRHVGSAAVLVDSVVGPLFLGGSWGESGRFRLYFGIGTLF
jgi:NTE family protein